MVKKLSVNIFVVCFVETFFFCVTDCVILLSLLPSTNTVLISGHPSQFARMGILKKKKTSINGRLKVSYNMISTQSYTLPPLAACFLWVWNTHWAVFRPESRCDHHWSEVWFSGVNRGQDRGKPFDILIMCRFCCTSMLTWINLTTLTDYIKCSLVPMINNPKMSTGS